MFRYINKQSIAGFIGNDPVIRYLPSGTAVLELRVATTSSWKKGDEWQSHTEWHNCVFYKKLAEEVIELYKKGQGIFIEGRSLTRKWVSNTDGFERTRKEVIVDSHFPIRYEPTSKTKEQIPTPPAEEIPEVVEAATGYDTL